MHARPGRRVVHQTMSRGGGGRLATSDRWIRCLGGGGRREGGEDREIWGKIEREGGRGDREIAEDRERRRGGRRDSGR